MNGGGIRKNKITTDHLIPSYEASQASLSLQCQRNKSERRKRKEERKKERKKEREREREGERQRETERKRPA